MEDKYLISAVAPQKKKKDRYNIYIDGEYAASLGAEACAVFGIRAGAEIAPDKLHDAVREDNRRYAFDSAIAMLARKRYARAEIVSRLTEKGIDSDAIDTAIDMLAGYGYIDDAAYANDYVESAITAGRYGRKVVAYKLRQKGVDDDIVDSAMAAYTDDIEHDIAARQVSALRAQHTGGHSAEAGLRRGLQNDARQKIYATLARRGFSYDIISSLLAGDNDF
jgi:regulatory protein